MQMQLAASFEHERKADGKAGVVGPGGFGSRHDDLLSPGSIATLMAAGGPCVLRLRKLNASFCRQFPAESAQLADVGLVQRLIEADDG